ncbi:hypothetical protein D3C85_1087440 [compost metagenome]
MKRRNQIEPMRLRQACGLFAGLVEITAKLHHFAAEASHGIVLFLRVALRNDNQRLQAHRACRQRQALPMVAAGGGENALHLGMLAFEPVHEGNAAAHLESAGRCVVFMLDPHRATQPLSQQGPTVLGGGRHHLVNLAGCLFDIVASQSVHE